MSNVDEKLITFPARAAPVLSIAVALTMAGLSFEMDVVEVLGSEDFTTVNVIDPLPVVGGVSDDEAGGFSRPPVLHPVITDNTNSITAIFFSAVNNFSITISLGTKLFKI